MERSRRIPNYKRYWQKVDKRGVNECWPWTGSKLGRSEFGQFYIHDDTKRLGHRAYAAHRFAYELVHGKLPIGRQVRHTCSNKLCQNPRHLYVLHQVSEYEQANLCVNGHILSLENVQINPRTGTRICRICTRNRVQDYRDRQRMATVRTALPRRPLNAAF